MNAWVERLHAGRDRMMASPVFRRWAAAVPLTRPVATRRARQVFDLCAGFVYSQALLGALRLGLFEHLRAGPLPLGELSARLGIPEAPLQRLLDALRALRLLELRRRGRYGLGPLGAPLVRNPGLAAMVEHNVLLYDDLRDPVALLRGERSGAVRHYWPYASSAAPADCTAGQVSPYSALMAASQSLIAEELLDLYSFGPHRAVLDVGGGDGAFLRALAPRAPDARLLLFDLPAVAALARVRLAQAGLGERVEAIEGDFFRDPLPRGADAITLVRVLHDHDDEAVERLLTAVREALPTGGRVVIAEPMMEGGRPDRVGGAYFALYLLALGSGRPRTVAEYRAALERAGFRRVQRLGPRRPVQASVVVATR